MVLGHTPKNYRHMMKNLISSLILHERIQTTHAKAKRLSLAANKLIRFAKKADKGFTSPINLIKGRVTTEQVYKKLMMETIPKLDPTTQNFVSVSRKIRYRRGDNAPVVTVTLKGSEKQEVAKIQMREAKQKIKSIDTKTFARQMFAQQKALYQKLMNENPEKAEFFKAKISRVEFDQWVLDKKKGQRRVQFLI